VPGEFIEHLGRLTPTIDYAIMDAKEYSMPGPPKLDEAIYRKADIAEVEGEVAKGTAKHWLKKAGIFLEQAKDEGCSLYYSCSDRHDFKRLQGWEGFILKKDGEEVNTLCLWIS